MTERFSRQSTLITNLQARLAEAHVVVVGAGGTGSPTCLQLAYLGVGHLTVIDFDHVDESNLNRIYGASQRDADDKTPKVRVVARVLADQPVKVSAIEQAVTSENIDDLLDGASLVMSCVDTHLPRHRLNDWTRRHNVPFIDMGCKADPVEDGVDLYANIRICLPDGPCLNCMKVLDSDRLALEEKTAEEQRALIREGYAQHADVESAIIPLTTGTAAYAVAAAVHILATGTTPGPRHYMVNLTTAERTIPPEGTCRGCAE